ncbi:methyltransferase-domain-containing protein [Auriculariales sp. MPI-PUGE-AT-0066]|nr:methyltransferase-domain-containing protein [Auriculariales sp. MPI-PUGE-AT-0066]
MKQKLDGAQFRYINEVLYKTDSTEASKMMQDDPGMFNKYHSGFRRQVESWPTNPVDIFIKELATLPAGSVIADLGCGEAAIAQNMTPRGYCVLSYDLVSTSPFVVAADTCSHIPLPGREESSDGTVVDVCVCALSLMNSNWLSCVREVRRVLKNTGKFKVAEVTSRFKDVDKFVELVEKVGFKLLSKRTPSTHFTLFEFRRLPDRPVSEKAWAELTAQQSILQPCEYKRR